VNARALASDWAACTRSREMLMRAFTLNQAPIVATLCITKLPPLPATTHRARHHAPR
jgi:hypothetical protein